MDPSELVRRVAVCLTCVTRPPPPPPPSPPLKPSNFSIDHILRHAGTRPRHLQDSQPPSLHHRQDHRPPSPHHQRDHQPPSPHHQRDHQPPSPQQQQELFDWLQCTRYRPPKLHRPKKKEGCVRRKLGRNPRIPFSAAQVAVLEDRFRASPYLSAADVSHLSTLLRLSDTRIKIWFQNRRARERRDHGKVETTVHSPSSRQTMGPIKSAFTPTPAAAEITDYYPSPTVV